jgi:hypothetical protein
MPPGASQNISYRFFGRILYRVMSEVAVTSRLASADGKRKPILRFWYVRMYVCVSVYLYVACMYLCTCIYCMCVYEYIYI